MDWTFNTKNNMKYWKTCSGLELTQCKRKVMAPMQVWRRTEEREAQNGRMDIDPTEV